MTIPRSLMSRSHLCHAAGALKAQSTALQKRLKLVNAEIKEVNRAIAALDAEDIMVSDHAVVRWLERRHGLDLEGVRAEIAKVAKPHVGSVARVPIDNGLVLLIDGNRVVTIMPEGDKE